MTLPLKVFDPPAITLKFIGSPKRVTKNDILAEKHISDIESLYNDGYGLTKIGKDLGIDRKYLSALFARNSLKVRGLKEYERKFDLNQSYFDNIDSEEKAYMMGFIYADGCHFPSKHRLSIQLAKKDEEILKKFSKALYYDQEVLNYCSVTRGIKKFEYTSLTVFSEQISKRMNELGVVERKSFKITFPTWLDRSLYSHFIRGLIDGDGWIYLSTNNRYSPSVGLICTKSINDFLQAFFEKELDIKSYLCGAHKQDFNVMCEIRVKNYQRCKILLDWLYRDSTIYLKRKHDLYLNFLNRYSTLRQMNK